MPWTLEYSGTEKPFDEWGMVRVRRDVDSQGPDILGFDAEGMLMDADADIPDGGEIIVRTPAGVVWFVGRRITNPRVGSPELERLSFVFAGPWWYLERMVFQQTWKSSSALAVISEVTLSRLFLQQTITGTKQTTGAQISEVITWVRARMLAQYGSYKLQAGTGFPAVDAPIDEVNDITCAEAIRKCMRWSPDSVLWFDYSTTPPTLNCKKRASLTGVTLALGNGTDQESLQITSRDDLLVPSVHFKYRQTAQIDGQSYVRTYTDLAPGGADGLEFGALVATFDFDGGSRTTATAAIVTENIAPTTLAWWQAREPKLLNKNLANVALVSGSNEVSPADGNTKELVDGQIADWMGFPVVDKVIKVKVSADLYDRDVSVTTVGATKQTRVTYDLSHQCKATTAGSGTYSATLSESSPEVLPSGLAAAVYASLATVQWQGSHTLVESEVTGQVGVGNVLNLSDGRAAWSTMNALVQAVSYDLDAGRTSVSFGPSPFLGPGDLIELLRVSRTRQIHTAATSRTAATGSSGNITLGNKLSKQNSSPISSSKSLQVYVQDVADPAAATKTIRIETTASIAEVHLNDSVASSSCKLALSDIVGKDVKFREMAVCVDGVSKLVKVLCSEPY